MLRFLAIVLLCRFLLACSDNENTSREIESAESVEAAQVAGAPVEELTKKVTPGEAYLYINSKMPNVIITESGLQYNVMRSGEGQSPSINDNVVTHYHGTFIDGTVFDPLVFIPW